MKKIIIAVLVLVLLVAIINSTNRSNEVVIWQYRNFLIPDLDKKFSGLGEKHLYKINSVSFENNIIHVTLNDDLTFMENILHLLMAFNIVFIYPHPDFAFHEFTFDLNSKVIEILIHDRYKSHDLIRLESDFVAYYIRGNTLELNARLEYSEESFEEGDDYRSSFYLAAEVIIPDK